MSRVTFVGLVEPFENEIWQQNYNYLKSACNCGYSGARICKWKHLLKCAPYIKSKWLDNEESYGLLIIHQFLLQKGLGRVVNERNTILSHYGLCLRHEGCYKKCR